MGTPLDRNDRTGRTDGYLLLHIAFLVVAFATGIVGAAELPRFRGKPLAEALALLQERGLHIIYSSAIVDEKMIVTVEPTAAEPRAVLEEILGPLGLQVLDGPGGALLIVRSSPKEVTGTLRGRVVSTARGTPIVGATLTVTETAESATTQPDGTFEMRGIHEGLHEVVVQAAGYYTRTLAGIRIHASGETGVTVRLRPLPTYLEEIIVTPSRLSLMQEDQSSGLSVTDEDAVLVPTYGGDLSRIVESLPGVAAPDNSAAFNIRGSQTSDVSFILDGLELYEPFHLLRFQSPFSFVDADIVDTIDFIGGAFTADFGDRHGGVVKVSTWAPEEPHRTRVGVSSLNTRVSHGAPLRNGKGSWLASGRTWYPGAFGDRMEFEESGLDPRFGDAYLSLSLNVSPSTVVSAHTLMAYDQFDFRESQGNETVDSANRSGYFWLRALKTWPSEMVTETILSAGRLEQRREGFSEPEQDLLFVDDERVVNFFGLKQDLSYQIGGAHLIRGGAEVRSMYSSYDYASGPAADPAAQTSIQIDPRGFSISAYAAYRAAVNEHFAAEVGVRYDRQSVTEEHQVSPRLNAIWRLTPRSELRLGLGQYYQSQRIHELHVEDGETDFLPAELSRQAALTFQQRLPADLSIRFDAYYRRLTRLHPRFENLFNPIELYPETESDRVLISADHARLSGVEILFRTAPERPFYGTVSYAWSRAEDVIDGDGIPRSWDQRHAGKLLVGYRTPDKWSVSLGGTAHTGWPTTPVTATATTLPGGGIQFTQINGDRNSERFPAYVRFDMKASRSFEIPRGKLRLDLEVLNLTDRENTCCVEDFKFELRASGDVEVDRELKSWRGRTPTFSIVWEF